VISKKLGYGSSVAHSGGFDEEAFFSNYDYSIRPEVGGLPRLRQAPADASATRTHLRVIQLVTVKVVWGRRATRMSALSISIFVKKFV